MGTVPPLPPPHPPRRRGISTAGFHRPAVLEAPGLVAGACCAYCGGRTSLSMVTCRGCGAPVHVASFVQRTANVAPYTNGTNDTGPR